MPPPTATSPASTSPLSAPQPASPYLDSLAVTPQKEPLDTRCRYPRGDYRITCQHGSIVWRPRRCRRCEGCLRAKAVKRILRITQGATAFPTAHFLTLTSLPNATWPQIMEAFERMVRWLRTTSPNLQYAAVKEQGAKTRMKHLHVVLGAFAYTPWNALSAHWQKLTGAWSVSISSLESLNSLTYVAKYCAKSQSSLRKTITYSRNWPKLSPPPSPLDITFAWGAPERTTPLPVAPNGDIIEFHSPRCT